MEQIKVILVDDEYEFIKSLSERFRMRDIESDIAFNGDQALQFLAEEMPDVMVLDLKMPNTDGLEVLRQVKKNYPQLLVIILTGHGSEKVEEEARRLGAFDYLEKPTEINKLIETIKKAYKYKQKMEGAAKTDISA